MLTRVAIGLLFCVVCSSGLTLKRGSPKSSLAVHKMVRGSVHSHLRTARFSRRINKTVVAVIDCDNQPCKNNAKCHQGSHCECQPGWTGLLCEIPVPPEMTKCGFENGMCLSNYKQNKVNFTTEKVTVICTLEIQEYALPRWCARFELNVRPLIVTSNVVCFVYTGINSAGKLFTFGITRASEGDYFAVTESSNSSPTYGILHSHVVRANSLMVLSFDYWTVGTGILRFHVIDVDTGASYFLMADRSYSGRWKSFNVTIAAGANIVYFFTGVTGGPLDEGEPRYGLSPEFGAAAVDNVRLTVKQ